MLNVAHLARKVTSAAEYGTKDANPDGRYPSNIIGEVQPEHQNTYAPRATRKEKGDNNNHPTVKPVSLMEYLVKIYSPECGQVLDPFLWFRYNRGRMYQEQ